MERAIGQLEAGHHRRRDALGTRDLEDPTGHHWIRLKLVGTKSNRDAIGAWIKVRVNQQIFWRQVMPTRSYLSQSELPVTVGFGAVARPDELEIFWPSGSHQKIDLVPVDRMLIVTEPR